MKNISITLICLTIFCCGNKNVKEYKLSATCEKIIIQDSLNFNVTHFLVSFHNTGQKDIVIFANSYNNKALQNNKYEQAGIFLKGLNVNTPIGQFHTSNTFYICAGKSIKILYSYGEQYPNQKIKFDSKKSLNNQLKDLSLAYIYNKSIMDNILNKKEFDKLDVVTVSEDFNVDMSNANIEYNKKLNIEDVIKLTDGKIN
jgi:hypothetical protein